METKVYYGEYSLSYWLGLMLSSQIELPPYQRYFVWDEEQLSDLIESIKNQSFVPPITIGAYFEGARTRNYIIDGQQRLSSVLLAWLDRFPIKDKFKAADANLAGDASDEQEESERQDVPREWRYDLLVSDERFTRDLVRAKCSENLYSKIGCNLPDDFFDKSYIGFSYIVPCDKGEDAQQAYYSRVFRDLNIRGVQLKELDSRRSLYFLKQDYDKFFDPDFLHDIFHVTTFGNAKKERLDFVRYLSLVAEYSKRNNYIGVGRGSRKAPEKYYESYVSTVVGTDSDERFEILSLTIAKGQPIPQIERFKMEYSILGLPKEYTSIVDMDINFFGLVYWVLQKGRSIRRDGCEALREKLRQKAESIKADASVSKSPSALKNLQNRMKLSINIYEDFLVDEHSS